MVAMSAPTRADGTRLRVLAVDDEENLAQLLSMAFTYEGFEVRTAASGRAAVAAAREFGPDAIVLDWMLPDYDGLEVLRKVRAFSPEVSVLFLTARDAVEDRIAGLTAGGDEFESAALRDRIVTGGATGQRDDRRAGPQPHQPPHRPASSA